MGQRERKSEYIGFLNMLTTIITHHFVVSSLAKFLGLSGSYPSLIVKSYASLYSGIMDRSALM
jgi:hypothetical protein